MEEALVGIDTQEASDVSVVGQGGTETDDTDVIASLLIATQGSAHNALNNRTTLIVKQMDFIDTDQLDEVDVAGVGGLAGDDVVLLGGCDDDLGLGNLLFCQLTITSKLSNLDSVRL